MISNIHFGHHPSDDENQRISRTREPQMEVTWPKREILMVNLSVYNNAKEPIVADIRLYAAYFDDCREPPSIETQVSLAAILGTRVFFGGQIIPDSSMCAGGIWTSGPTALKLPERIRHVLLLAKIDKPRARCEFSFVNMNENQHLLLWSSEPSKLKELRCEV